MVTARVDGIDALLALTEDARERGREDPFGKPVLSVALVLTRMMDGGELDEARIAALIGALRDRAFAARAARLARYVGGPDEDGAARTGAEIGARVAASGDFAAAREALERVRFAAVFTAHPTFALPPTVYAALAAAAAGEASAKHPAGSHRPTKPSLAEEFARAADAIGRARDAIDALNAALLGPARDRFPQDWTALRPCPVVVASWVGYDTDGRTDIAWWDTIRLRLEMKRLQLRRLLGQVDGAPALRARIGRALAATEGQIGAAPADGNPDQVARFARALIDGRDAALSGAGALMPLFDAAISDAAADGERLRLMVARAGLAAHGLSLAHTHVRLNAAQLHNTMRQRAGILDPPEDPSRRRALLARVNAALDEVRPVPVDFGAVLDEQASASRLMMTVAQIVKHIDGETPIRFLIAETETGYTLLAALWLARLFGVEDRVEISPLFETADALDRGARVLDEALRSPHYRDYLRRTGRLALQFGYSDSGRFVGQLAASYLVERLRLKIAETLARHGVSGVSVILFDTHGESFGRGGHPRSLVDRFLYLSPRISRHALARAGFETREETSFQGGDGYLLFATPALANATVARIVEQAFADRSLAPDDPVYADPDFAADFFGAVQAGMRALVDDPGYAALLTAFGPALLDPTGSRSAAREHDSGPGAPARHPRELRAIPNNAILQQLGWCANSVHGLGAAASRHPETTPELHARSERFRRAMDLAAAALEHSDIEVLRAVVATLDPGTWLDRAAHARRAGRPAALVAVARALEASGMSAPVQATFRRVQADALALRAVWPNAPRMATHAVLLHALRLALIHRIWLLGTEIPEFSPRHGLTRAGLMQRVLRLELPEVLRLLAEIFPLSPDETAARDFGEPPGSRAVGAYAREHAEIIGPMGRLFDLVREIGVAITHEVGVLG